MIDKEMKMKEKMIQSERRISKDYHKQFNNQNAFNNTIDY